MIRKMSPIGRAILISLFLILTVLVGSFVFQAFLAFEGIEEREQGEAFKNILASIHIFLADVRRMLPKEDTFSYSAFAYLPDQPPEIPPFL